LSEKIGVGIEFCFSTPIPIATPTPIDRSGKNINKAFCLSILADPTLQKGSNGNEFWLLSPVSNFLTGYPDASRQFYF
jgi:hypothetical protein